MNTSNDLDASAQGGTPGPADNAQATHGSDLAADARMTGLLDLLQQHTDHFNKVTNDLHRQVLDLSHRVGQAEVQRDAATVGMQTVVKSLSDEHKELSQAADELLFLENELREEDGGGTGKVEAARDVPDALFGSADARPPEELRRRVSMLIDRLTVSKKALETIERLVKADERIKSVEYGVAGLSASMIQTVNAVNQATIDQRAERLGDETRLLEAIVRSRYAVPQLGRAAEAPAPIVGPILSLPECERRLREMAPLSWEAFVACRDTGTESYDDLPEVSCSTERHPQAHLFRAFIHPYLKGTVLDIGCGPQPVPFYLAGYPTRAISGIDPISSSEDHPFQFVSGYGEFLPWADEVFDVAISGTVLDHYYLLDRGLEEVFRVLKPGGRFLAWITHFTNAPPYDPYSAPVKPYDHEHMYHINLEWFRPLMEEIGFVENEIVEFPLPFRFLFMSFEKPGDNQWIPDTQEKS